MERDPRLKGYGEGTQLKGYGEGTQLKGYGEGTQLKGYGEGTHAPYSVVCSATHAFRNEREPTT
jgi:hypothetical protein